MRVKLFLAGLALAIALPAQAQAWLYNPRHVHRAYYPAPAPNIVTDRDYDRARVYADVHGAWPDGGDHAGWVRGERLPLAAAINAPTIDWRAAYLYPPRDGYRWTRVGDDYLLVGRETRAIRAVVLAPTTVRGVLPAAAKVKKPYVTTFKVKAVKRPASYYEK
jgi:Ni/Co efflux regulator RcnB